MSLISLVVVLVIIGLLLWAVQNYITDQRIKNLLFAAIILITLIWLLSSFGVIGPLHDLRIG